MDADRVGPLVRSRRRAARLSQEELAGLTGLSLRTIGDLERGMSRRTGGRWRGSAACSTSMR